MRVVLVPSVHSLEPATVDRDHGLGEQVQPSAKHYELAAGRPDRWSVVLAKIGDGLEIRHQASGQPHQFDVTLGLPLQAPARRDAVEIAVEIDLQQRRWMVSRAPVVSGTTPAKPVSPDPVRR